MRPPSTDWCGTKVVLLHHAQASCSDHHPLCGGIVHNFREPFRIPRVQRFQNAPNKEHPAPGTSLSCSLSIVRSRRMSGICFVLFPQCAAVVIFKALRNPNLPMSSETQVGRGTTGLTGAISRGRHVESRILLSLLCAPNNRTQPSRPKIRYGLDPGEHTVVGVGVQYVDTTQS